MLLHVTHKISELSNVHWPEGLSFRWKEKGREQVSGGNTWVVMSTVSPLRPQHPLNVLRQIQFSNSCCPWSIFSIIKSTQANHTNIASTSISVQRFVICLIAFSTHLMFSKALLSSINLFWLPSHLSAKLNVMAQLLRVKLPCLTNILLSVHLHCIVITVMMVDSPFACSSHLTCV